MKKSYEKDCCHHLHTQTQPALYDAETGTHATSYVNGNAYDEATCFSVFVEARLACSN
jgi:hypothetical protein